MLFSTLVPLIFLSLIAVVPYLALLHGQYLYDDFQVILHNPDLSRVTHFVDCFTFVLKPSKPVTNFFLALGQWLGGGSIVAHRAISLAVHAACTCLLYLNARRFGAAKHAFWIAALFALAPVHTESIGVILFRMDCLGTLFSLLALLIWGRLDEGVARRWEWGVLFFAFGAAVLSKEVFAAILPLTLFAFSPRRFVTVAGLSFLWGGVLLKLLERDAASGYPYAEVIGRGVQPAGEQLALVARAWSEAVYKFITGRGLSILPPRARAGGWDSPLVVIGGAIALFVIARRSAWGMALAAGLVVYAAVPNLNLGSEHYLYFPAAAACVLMVSLVRYRWALCVLAASWLVATEARVSHLGTRLELHLADVQSHPEAALAWNNAAAALLEVAPPSEALPYLEHARRLAPGDPNVLVTELVYRVRVENIDEAEHALGKIERNYPGKPRTLAAFEFAVGQLAEKKGECPRAEAAYARARQLDAANESYRRTCERGKG